MKANWPPTIEQVKAHQANPWAGYTLRQTTADDQESAEQSSLDYGIAAALAAIAIIAAAVLATCTPEQAKPDDASACVEQCARLRIDTQLTK